MNELALPFAVMVLTVGVAVWLLYFCRKWLKERDRFLAEAGSPPKAAARPPLHDVEETRAAA